MEFLGPKCVYLVRKGGMCSNGIVFAVGNWVRDLLSSQNIIVFVVNPTN